MASGGDFWKGAADGFLAGTITGAVSGAFTAGMGTVGGTILSNPIVQNTVESAVDVVSESAVTIAQGGEVSAMDMLGEFAFGAVTGLDIPGGNKIDDALDAINTKQLKQATENFTEGVEELATNKQVKNTLEEVRESGVKTDFYATTDGTIIPANKVKANSRYDRLEVEDYSGRSVRPKNATDDWDSFLGPNQTDIDPRTGQKSLDRIWSEDGTRSIRFGDHEMDGMGTKNFHYHRETWYSDYVYNEVQRIQPR